MANLSLLALGTSAPEILLSVIEICGKGFVAGELGPGTIVGSAAFNLLVISAICIVSIPDGQIRKIASVKVFAVTAFTGKRVYFARLIRRGRMVYLCYILCLRYTLLVGSTSDKNGQNGVFLLYIMLDMHLGVFLLPVFTRLGHVCQDLLSPYDGMHVCTD